MLWGLWNPTDRLETVTAAVVNQDRPVTVDGQLVPLGRVLAAELIGSATLDSEENSEYPNFTWVLTNESDAAAGLSDGRYTTVVTIPKNFSYTATSFSRAAAGKGTPERAVIDIETSDRGKLLDSAVSSIITSAATSVINAQLGAQFVGGVFVGMTELSAGLGEAAEGAAQLADGGAQLADGAAHLASGTAQLSTGAQGLSSGAAELASGARKAASGGAQLADGVGQYVDSINGVLAEVQNTAPGLTDQLEDLYDAIEDGSVTLPPPLDPQNVLDQLRTVIDGIDGLGGDLDRLIAGGNELASGVRASAKGQQQLASGLEDYSAGMRRFAAGAPGLADGAAQLADGVQQAADGTAELSDGLKDAVEGIPSYSDDMREKLAEIAVQPVEAVGADGELFTASGVPLFAGIALWAGAFASFLTLTPLWRRTRDAARGVGYITMRSIWPAVWIGAVQGAIVGLILPLLLGYDSAQMGQFLLLSLLAGVVFSLLNQGLSALFGGFGRFLALAVLALAFAIGVVSTAPASLQAIGGVSPVGVLFDGFQSIAMGSAGVGSAAFNLALWGLGGIALTAYAVMRSRRAR